MKITIIREEIGPKNADIQGMVAIDAAVATETIAPDETILAIGTAE